MTEIKNGMNIMRIKNIITFLLLLISTNSLSDGKWLSYGHTMINLNNVKVIQQGYNIDKFLHDNVAYDVAYDDALFEFQTTDINKINSPIKRCVNVAHTMTYKEWVKKAKRDTGKIHSGYYLWDYSPIKDTSGIVLEIKSNLGYSLTEIVDTEKDMESLGLYHPPTNDELFEMYNNITSYNTFTDRYLYKYSLSKHDQESFMNKMPKMSMDPLKRKEMYEGLDKVINSLLPVSIDEYDRWLGGSEKEGQYYKNTIIEETYNLKDHYLSNTVPMYHNSIKFDDFELTLSGISCDLNLVSSESESEKLIQDTLSRIGNFINSDKHYMELF